MNHETIWEKYSDRITTMQYPYDSTGKSKLFDGKKHEILPKALIPFKIAGREYGVLRYLDKSMKTEAVTLVTKIGDTLARVELDDYSVLFDFIEANNIFDNKELVQEFPILSSPIALTQTVSAQELLAPQNVVSNKPIFKFKEYVPVPDYGIESSNAVSFSFLGVKFVPYFQDQSYLFNKAVSFPAKIQGIQAGINRLPDAGAGIYGYKFRVDVKEGAKGSTVTVDKDGQVTEQDVLLIPGIHEYAITYAPCEYLADYNASRYAHTMLIRAPWPEYEDHHDIDIAFNDGCNRNLPTEYYDKYGNRVPDIEKSLIKMAERKH